MKKYKLIQKVIDDSRTSWARIAATGKLESDLALDVDYHIQQYRSKKHLFYVYIKEDGIEKVCVYEKC